VEYPAIACIVGLSDAAPVNDAKNEGACMPHGVDMRNGVITAEA
jgi:hypothetical protein